MKIAFFGVPEPSLIVLEKLFNAGFQITCVVTKPPRPIGRKQILTPTPVAVWAKQLKIPLITPLSDQKKPWLFSDEKELTQEVLKYQPDILITADFTQKIPINLINQIRHGGLNVHPSLLPAYRGPAPVPWAILNGETQTGVSIVTLSETFDQGHVITQQKEPILPTDTTPILLNRLFTKGADLLVRLLKSPKLLTINSLQPTTCNLQPSYFPRLTRDTGFEPFINIKKALENGTEAKIIDRKFRALTPWPGLWTKVKINDQEKRLKILNIDLSPITNHLSLTEIQLEGKLPVSGKEASKYLQSII